MGATMRALFLAEARRLELREVPIPQPRKGEALVRVRVCGICGSDLTVFKTGALAGPGTVLGHEVVADVVDDPTGTWQPGTRVVVYPPRGCGECYWCRRGEPRHCERPDDRRRWGGFAEYAVFPAAHLIEVADSVSDEAAALADPLGVALRAVSIADPERGALAYVNGLGPIGLCSVSALVTAGCVVLAGDPIEERRRHAVRLGASLTLDPTREDVYEVARTRHPAGPRIAFECSGTAEGLQDIFDDAGPGAVIGILGIPSTPVLLLRMTVREQRAFSVAGPTVDSMRAALRHVGERPELVEIVTGRVGLADVEAAMTGLVAGEGGVKVLVDPAR